MFTEDFLVLAVGYVVECRAVVALYLTSFNMGPLLAGMSESMIGTSMRHIGAAFFFTLGIAVIPQDKVIRALYRLTLAMKSRLPVKE